MANELIAQADWGAPIMSDPLMDPIDAQIWRTIVWFAGACSLADIEKFKELMSEKPIALSRTKSLAPQEYGRVHTDGSRSGGQPPSANSEELVAAAWYYMSQIGQGYMAENLPFTKTQEEADKRLRAALAAYPVPGNDGRGV